MKATTRMTPVLVASLVIFISVFSGASSAVVKHYCGTDLADALHSVCKQDGFAVLFPPVRSASLNAARGIVEECCINPCSTFQLGQYCNNKQRKLRYTSKSKRSHNSINFTKRTKGKRNAYATVWQCKNQASLRKGNRSSSRSRRRRNRLFDKKARGRTISSTLTTTTEVPWSPEVQYVDDWVDSGEEPHYVGPSAQKVLADASRAYH